MKRHLAITVLCLLPVAATPQDDDKGYLTTLIEDNLSGDTRTVNIVGFAGALSSEATIQQLTIADSDGIWLTLEDVTLIWSRAALLRGAIDVDQLSASRIIVARAPLPDTSLPSAEATPFALPELPVSIALDQLQVDRIELGDSFLGEPLAFGISGAAGLAGGEGSVAITAERLDGKTGSFVIDGAYANSTNVLALTLDLVEGADGIVAGLAQLPGRPSVALNIAGDAPLDAFAATLRLATDGQDRVQGDFVLNSDGASSSFGVNIAGDVAPLLAPDYQDFFGPNVTLTANGQQDAGGFVLDTLDLRTQKLALRGAARFDADGWPARLDLTGSIADAGGDPVLLPLSGAKTFVDRVDLNLAYDRDVSNDWTADFDIAGLTRPGLSIDTLGLNGGGQIIAGGGTAVGAVTANMTYAADGLALDDVGAAEALGDQITGVFDLTYAEGAPMRIPQLTLTGPGIDLNAEATVLGAEDGFETQATAALRAEALDRFATLAGQPDLSGAADLDVTLQTRPLDGLFDLALFGQTRDLQIGIAQLDPLLTGTGSLTLDAARDAAGTRLDTLRVATDQALITAKANLTSGGATADFDVNVQDVGLVVAGLNGPARLTGDADRTASGVTGFDITATAPATRAVVKGTVTEITDGAEIDADVQASISDIAGYRSLAGQDIGGALDLSLTGMFNTATMAFAATVDSTTDDLRTGLAQVDPLLTGQGSLSLQALSDGASYILNDLALRTDQARILADATYGPDGGNADFDASVSDLGLVVPDVTGPANVTGTAQRNAAGVTTFDTAITAPEVRAKAAGTVTEAPDSGPAIAADVTATLTDLSRYRSLMGQPIAGAIDLQLTGGLDTATQLFEGDLTARSRDLQTGIDQLDPLLRGAGNWRITAARTGADSYDLQRLSVQTPGVDLTASGAGGLTGAATATVALNLPDAGLALPGLTGPLAINLAADRDVTETAKVQLTADGIGTKVDLDATIAPPAQDYALSGTLQAQIDSLRPFAELAGQSLSGGVDLDLRGSGLPDLSALDAQIAVQTRNLAIGNPQVDQLISGAGQLAAKVSRNGDIIEVPQFSASTGQLNASGSLTTDGSTGQASFQAGLANVGLFTDQLSGPVNATGTAALNANQSWGLDVSATGPGGINARANGAVTPGGNLNIDLTGGLPLGLANDLLDPRRITGDAQFDLSINGPAALSSVSGRISTSGARLAAPTLGQALSDITGGVTLNGTSAAIDLNGTVQTGGQLQITGPVALSPPFAGDIRVALDQIVLSDPNLYQTSVDGSVSLTGPLTGGARIAGVLNLGQTDVQVPSSGIGALGDLPDVTHLGASAAVRTTLDRAGANAADTAAAESTGPGFPLDVTINAPSRIFIRGRGLDAELGGTLNIGGTTNNIIPVGQFDLIRGRIDILQQRFELDEGAASLQGDFIPVIRLVATTEAATGTVIQIIVSGPADAPEVTFESTPNLPQDEVLSQLIFGRNLSEISPLQAVQLAAAVGTLAGRGGGGIIDNFRQGVGLDDFDVTTDEDGNAAVRAGAYLSENIYTDVTINAEGETEINLNLDITSDITAKGTVDADGETSIGVFFERDY